MKRPGSTAPGSRTRRRAAGLWTALLALWIVGIPTRASGDDASQPTRGLTAVARPLVPAERAGEKVDLDGSAGLFVGVGRFDSVSGLADLRYTPDDAVALAHLFALEFKLIPPAHVRIALGGEPRSANGKTMLHELVEAGASVGAAKRVELLDALDATVRDASAPEGLLVVSVGSHGFEEKGTAYVMPSDGRRKYVGSTGVSVQAVKDTLREARANKRVLILDACRETLGTEVRGEAKMDAALRGALKASEGFAILASCGAGQLSWESPELEQGVFTHFLLEAVRGGAGADSSDGFIRLGDASAHATRATRDWVKAQKNEIQEPWFEGELGRSIPLAVHPAALRRREEALAAETRLDSRRQNARRLLALAVAEDTENQLPSDTLVAVRSTLDRLAGKNLEELLVELEALSENTPRNRRIFAQYWKERRPIARLPAGVVVGRPIPLSVRPAAPVGESPPQTSRTQEVLQDLLLDAPSMARAETPWTNSLGMPFVPVPGTKSLMCVWETRRMDYAAFAAAIPRLDTNWQHPSILGGAMPTGSNNPVVAVSWGDARAFCEWLTTKEHDGLDLKTFRSYRLPTDLEWSRAVGFASESGRTPRERDARSDKKYPWGSDFPPTTPVGNYRDVSSTGVVLSLSNVLKTYRDGYPTLAPVGSFPSNEFGFHDLGGNVSEWCEDLLDPDSTERVVRGGSWYDQDEPKLRSGARRGFDPLTRGSVVGFRVVLDGAGDKAK